MPSPARTVRLGQDRGQRVRAFLKKMAKGGKREAGCSKKKESHSLEVDLSKCFAEPFIFLEQRILFCRP